MTHEQAMKVAREVTQALSGKDHLGITISKKEGTYVVIVRQIKEKKNGNP